jgi:hypothetical protein
VRRKLRRISRRRTRKNRGERRMRSATRKRGSGEKQIIKLRRGIGVERGRKNK